MTKEVLIENLKKLSRNEQLEIANRLFDDIKKPSTDLEQERQKIVEERYSAIKKGKPTIPFKKVQEEIKAKYGFNR